MEISPSLVGRAIVASSHSFEMPCRSPSCVINVATTRRTDQVIGIGNTSGVVIDRFTQVGPTADNADIVAAPLIRGGDACLGGRLHDDTLVGRYHFFV